jgi:signal transduction histidine kinase/ActR/RegA family two-component response regulator
MSVIRRWRYWDHYSIREISAAYWAVEKHSPQMPEERSLSKSGERIAVEQIDTLFGNITISVWCAAIAAIILTATLQRLGALNPRTGSVWAGYIIICAVAHTQLCRFYRRSRLTNDRWQPWALWFTIISFAEGIGWGWPSIGLALAGRSDVKHLVFLIVGGVAAASIPVFSPFLPAFFAFFVPTVLGALVASITSADPIQQAAFPIILVFVGAMGALGFRANQSFRQQVLLRIRTEELAEDLARQKDIAERANLAKSTFLAAASHDLRQPVHALGLLAGALRGIAIPAEGIMLLDQIEASTNAMDGLFTALLDISRLDAGVVEVHRRPFAIGPLLARICRDHADEARAKDIALILKRSAATVLSDPVLLGRILSNLISNAVRYTDHGRIVVGCRRRGPAVSIQVWDTGRGIPQDQQERVFQEYYQLGNAERDRTKGLGLGLAIVRRMTDLLDCKLTLRSQPGRGSCFELTIPMPGSASEPVEAQPAALSGALARGLIVVIDDELAIQQAMGSLLTGWGHDVVTAGSGDEALQRLSSRPDRPELVICDYRLRDDENGITVIERMRSEYNQDIPAMLITGDTAPDRLAEARASQLILLHKPVSNSKLRAAIVNLIGSDKDDMAEASAPVK